VVVSEAVEVVSLAPSGLITLHGPLAPAGAEVYLDALRFALG
jgi:hypothetical protein